MADIPQAAIEAGVKAVLAQHGIEKRLTPTEDVVWPIVWVALIAAEEAWPHDPPKRDLTGTTATRGDVSEATNSSKEK